MGENYCGLRGERVPHDGAEPLGAP